MKYFGSLPKIPYSLLNNGTSQNVVDIFRGLVPGKDPHYDSIAYLNVDIADGERPDVLSTRLYGTPDFWWTPFVVNNSLKDGLSAWYRSTTEMDRYLDETFENQCAFWIPTLRVLTLGTLPYYTAEGYPFEHPGVLENTYLVSFTSANVFTGPAAAMKVTKWDQSRKTLICNPNLVYYFVPRYSAWDGIVPPWSTEYELIDLGSVNLDRQDHFLGTNFIAPGTYNWHLRYIPKTIEQFETFETVVSTLSALNTKPNPTSTLQDLQAQYRLYSPLQWSDARNSPYAWYSKDDSSEPVTAHDAFTLGYDAALSDPDWLDHWTSYTSWEEQLRAENENRRSIKVVRPEYIQSFAKDYMKKIRL